MDFAFGNGEEVVELRIWQGHVGGRMAKGGAGSTGKSQTRIVHCCTEASSDRLAPRMKRRS